MKDLIRGWGWSFIDKDVKYEVNVKIYDGVYWDVDIIVGYKVGRGNIGRLDIDISDEVASGDGEGV